MSSNTITTETKNLFDVSGLVAVITGGGSGKLYTISSSHFSSFEIHPPQHLLWHNLVCIQSQELMIIFTTIIQELVV